MIQVAAPSNLFADGYDADALRGRHYIARTQNRFHPRSLEQPHLGTGIGGRANKFTLTDFVTEFQCPLASGANAIRLPFDGINPRARARRTREVPVATNPDRGNQHGHGCCREGESEQAPLETTRARLHLPADGRRSINSAARRIRAARDTFPQVISYDECASLRKFLPMKSR